MNTNTVYLKEQDGKYIQIDGAEFSAMGMTITAMMDTYLERIKNNVHSGYIFFKRDGENCYLTYNGIKIDANGSRPVRKKVDINNIKVCLMPNGNIKLFRKSDDKLICDMGDCPEVHWREYARV